MTRSMGWVHASEKGSFSRTEDVLKMPWTEHALTSIWWLQKQSRLLECAYLVGRSLKGCGSEDITHVSWSLKFQLVTAP